MTRLQLAVPVALWLCCCVGSTRGGLLDAIFRRNRDAGSDDRREHAAPAVNRTQHMHRFAVHNERLDSPVLRRGIVEATTVRLANDVELPLVGAGVGNLPRAAMRDTVHEALKGRHGVRLFDTSHYMPYNEAHVSDGIRIVDDDSGGSETTLYDINQRVQVHVVTKVWYTHLGYERTKLSVRESLQSLRRAYRDPHVDLRVHVLLHWPKCYDSIAWMDCAAEEEQLPAHVRELGAPPHQHRDTAWKESWQALEDMYLEQQDRAGGDSSSSSSNNNNNNNNSVPHIASIGVSNFLRKDFQELLQMARIPPHIFQMNVQTVLHDPVMVALCEQHGVHIQLYNVFHGLYWKEQLQRTPHAHHHLVQIAQGVSKRSDSHTDITPAQIVLRWFVRHGISVVPRASSLQRLEENSPVSLFARVPDFEPDEYRMIAQCIEAMLTGEDLADDAFITVTFTAKSKESIVSWYQSEEIEIPLAYLRPGETYEDYTYPEHVYRMYDGDNTDFYQEFVVSGMYGESRHFEY